MGRSVQKTLKGIYSFLFKAYGPQHWWPGDTPFEVIVGAILTQNTNWSNVEKAILNLKKEKVLSVQKLHNMPDDALASLIKPAGFFNIKTKRLKNFILFFINEYQGSIKKMAAVELMVLRRQLLDVNGIGPETADSILLYALHKPVFVIDAYTKRLLSRHGLIDNDAVYQQMQDLFMRHLELDEKFFNEYHALIVRVGKDYCKTRAQCDGCPLKRLKHG